jgi:hypothetical protein
MSEENLIPKGYYKAKATKNDGAYAQLGLSSAGNQQVLVQFEIVEGPAQGRRIAWWGNFTEKTWERTVESLRYCGFQGDELDTLPSQTLDQVVDVEVEHSEYLGKVSAKVKWVNAPYSGIKLTKPMGSQELRNFSALMKAKVASVKTQVTPPSTSAHSAPPADRFAPDVSDDSEPAF